MRRRSGRDRGARAADTEAARRTGQTRGRSARAPVTALARVPLVPAVESPSRRVPILVPVVEAQPRDPRGPAHPRARSVRDPGSTRHPAVRAIGRTGRTRSSRRCARGSPARSRRKAPSACPAWTPTTTPTDRASRSRRWVAAGIGRRATRRRRGARRPRRPCRRRASRGWPSRRRPRARAKCRRRCG